MKLKADIRSSTSHGSWSSHSFIKALDEEPRIFNVESDLEPLVPLSKVSCVLLILSQNFDSAH